MRCYFTYDENTGEKVLIPGCWGTVHSGDMADCLCDDTFVSFKEMERKEFREKLQACNKEILELQKQIIRLEKRVEFWHKKAKTI